jgi:hypothetical protein
MLAAAVRRGEHPAAAAAGDRLDRLDQHLEFTADLTGGQHDEVVQAEQTSGQVVRACVSTVVHAWGLPAIRMLGRFGS